jgi:hypothetical protein
MIECQVKIYRVRSRFLAGNGKPYSVFGMDVEHILMLEGVPDFSTAQEALDYCLWLGLSRIAFDI